MSKCAIVILILVLVGGQSGAAGSVDARVIDAVSRLVLGLERTYQLGPQLAACCPGMKTEYDVLGALFGSIRDGNSTEEVWKAVYHLRDMGDGAWYLEYEAAAYDVLRASPTAYYERFLTGDDRATMLLDQAFDWTIDEIEVGPGCDPEWQETAAESQKVLAKALDAIRRSPSSGDWPRARRETFLAIAGKRYEEWTGYVQRHKGICHGQEKQGG